MAIENISQDIADLLATKDYDVKYTDGQGKDSSPEEAKTFAFDWVAGSGQNYGTVVIVIGDDNDLQLFFGDNLGKTMENPQDKLDWFGSERETGFLPELKNFATQHRYTFSPKDINQLKHTMQGMAAIKEGLFEGYYGTRKISYVGEQTEARLVIKHNRMIGEDDKRYRYVESLFIETVDGERFKLPFVKLSGGRAMLEHVKQGGRPYDIRGQHINEIVTEMAVLSRFNRASQQRVFEGITQELVETVQHYYSELRGNLQHMATGRGYNQYFESWTPADIGDETALVEDLKTMFIEQTLDARIEAALPTLAKIQQRGNAMKEAQIFENWVNNIMEGTWALPDTPEAQAKLDELMSQELIVGPDATNAKEQLYDVIGDDKLFDILADLAEQDPRANCWDDTDVQARLQELGIQMNTTPDAEQQQPVAPPAGQQAPGTAPEQAVAENTELNTMLKYAGVPVNESRIHENSEYTYEKVAKILARENPGLATDRNSKEFYSAVYHELIAIGMTPKAARNLISYDEDFMSDVASAYDHYQTNPGLDESNSGMIMPEADPIATVEAMPDLSAPVLEGTCNATMEGEYCPEHGLAECGMYEMGTVAGGMAPVMDEGDPNSLTGLAGQAVGYVTPNPSDAVAGFKKQFEDNEIVQNTRKLTDGWKGAVAGGAAGAMAGDLAGGALGSKIGQALGGAAGAAGGPIGSAAGQIAGNMAGEKIGQLVGGALGGAAGGVAGDKLGDKLNEKKDDPINYNAAITGAYYESKSDTALLARIKSLALLR